MAYTPDNPAMTIQIAKTGFYAGFNKIVAVGSKILIGALILWAAVFPKQAAGALAQIKGFVSTHFGAWYMYVVAFYLVICLGVSLWTRTGKLKLGRADEKPEFSNFSWFSMLFGAGVGIGMLTYSTAEPILWFSKNPDTIRGLVEGQTAETVRSAFKWSFLHWGLSVWGLYSLTGLALGYFTYARGLPLSLRSALVPLFGKMLSGPLGHIVDIAGILATLLGVAVTIGYGISQFAAGLYNISGADWILQANGAPTTLAMLLSLFVIMGASTLSALSGVSKGIKWLSNLNMGLSFFLLAFFLVFGATAFAFKALILGLWDYLMALPAMATHVWFDDGTVTGKALAKWQADWTIFYWAWWIAFAPFVGLFFARVSRGRSIREYVFGTMVVPAVMCFIWFALIGGTAINLELSGLAKHAIINTELSSQLYASINVMLQPGMAKAMSAVIVILLVTYLVTSADSAILVINTIASAGAESRKTSAHILVWGGVLTLMIAVLLLAGGLDAIKTAMIIGALPFSLIMALMGISLVKALLRDTAKNKPAR